MITPHDLADTDSFAGPERPPRAAPPPFSPALALADANTVASHEDPGSDMSSKGIAPTDAATSASGPRIGRYVLLSKLGEGGMGEVFAGYDRELDRRVALKVVRSRRVDDAHSQARMHREAQALARLSHPNVVQVHDVGEIGGQLFVAMEYVKGETLRTWQGRHDPTTPAGRRLILDMYVQAGRGLAAAHDAGIVHRDFKPDNVLVGDDGRARVLDFGLAAERRAADLHATATTSAHEGHRGPLDGDLTRTGSILGTPAYMAPEQFLARSIDPRTDVFAFSVALYEALYGETPFAGDTFTARQLAVVGGELRAAPPAAGIPSWLRAVVVHGLSREPSDRHPSMDAMLAALVDDPVERRRRRWRLLGLGLAAMTVTAVVLVGGLWGLERWERSAAEARAGERLTAVTARIDAALAAGATAEAEQAFTTFVGHPDNRGSAVLGRAWLNRAEQARGRDDTSAAVDAFAGAYTVASTAEDQTTALIGLARIFRDEVKWRGLLLTLSTLEGRGVAALEPTELTLLGLDAQIARRDLAGATALLRGPLAGSPRAALLPVLTALQRATETRHQHHGVAVVADLDGDGRLEIALETDARERQIAPLLRAEPELRPIGTLDLDRARFRALPSGPGEAALLVASESRTVDGEFERHAVVRQWRNGAPVELLRWREDGILAALGADIDGDGVHELLVGTGPYSRRVLELVHGADGAWSTRSPAPELDRRHSDVVALLAEDLDGDGTIEVIAALGPWHAYELQVLRHDPASDTLRMFTRHRLGNITGAATIRRGPPGQGPEIVVSKTDEYRNTTVFPRDRPFGEPAGLYLFRLVDDALVQTAFVPAPRVAAGARVGHAPPLIGDLDGDGRDELIVGCSVADDPNADNRDSTMIFVSADDGSTLPIVLGDLRPIAALDLDGDGDDELIVSDNAGTDVDRVWVLGSGPSAPPTFSPELPPLDVAAPADPVLARMWRHADELARMGLARQAAEGLQTVADLLVEPELRARAHMRAGELHESMGADTRAAERFARAAEEPAQEPAQARRAHESAARSFLRLGRIDAAATHIAAATRGVDEPATAVAAAIAALRTADRVDLDFDRPLDPTWRISQPLMLRRDGAREALHVDAMVLGELVSAPVRWAGQSLTLAVDLDLAQLEWRSGLEIGLVRDGTGLDDGSSPLGIEVITSGGGSERTHEFACLSYGRRSVTRVPFLVGEAGERLGHVSIRATLIPELGEWTCQVERANGEALHYARNRLVAADGGAGPLRLTIASSQGPAAWAEADIRRIELRGASLAGPALDAALVDARTTVDAALVDARHALVDARTTVDAALVDARHALVEDEPLAALAALARASAPTPADRLLGVVALARLARLSEAERALAPLLADQDTAAALTVTLKALLRTDPKVFGALVRGAAGPAEMRARLADAWFFPVVMERDPRAFAVAWSGLAERDLDADHFDVLKVHAIAAAGLGHGAAAQTSYRAALAALDAPARSTRVPPWSQQQEAGAFHLDLAALALAAGDEAAARRELRPFIAGPDADLSFVDRLRARDDLRVLWDLAPK
jgi:tRNA A-37 threonylcarbamoyl transferase component Bud32